MCSTAQAAEKNINAVKAWIDREKSGYKTDETRSALLPQINIAGNFQDYLKLPTTLINGDALGRPGVILLEMGVQYNTGAAVNVNQVLLNATAFTVLKIAKQAGKISRLGVKKQARRSRRKWQNSIFSPKPQRSRNRSSKKTFYIFKT